MMNTSFLNSYPCLINKFDEKLVESDLHTTVIYSIHIIPSISPTFYRALKVQTFMRIIQSVENKSSLLEHFQTSPVLSVCQ